MANVGDLQVYDEETLTREFIMNLLREMGYDEIHYAHGPYEEGKDIVFREQNRFGIIRWLCAQVKAEKISGDTRGDDHLYGLDNQVIEAFDGSYQSPTHGKIDIDELYVITSFSFTQKAKDLLKEGVRQRHIMKPLYFIDGEKLLQLLEEHDIPVKKEERYKRDLNKIAEALDDGTYETEDDTEVFIKSEDEP